MSLREVQWFGTHPSERVVSMDIYRDRLLTAVAESDPFSVNCWPSKDGEFGDAGRLARVFGKYVAYPHKVRKNSDVDLVHFLDHSSSHLIPFVPEGVFVVATLHDLIPLQFKGELTEGQVKRFRKNLENLRACDAIVSVSEYSKREAVELLGIEQEKIHVVPNGVSLPDGCVEVSAGAEELRKLGSDIIVLSVGSVLQRKNLSIIPKALKHFEERTGLKAGLLRVGQLLPDSLRREISDSLDGRMVEMGFVNDHEISCAYSSSDVVFIPSLFEGFGLPVLEAFSWGKPVAASDHASLPEVGGELAVYFSPTDPKEAGMALAQAWLEKDEKGAARVSCAEAMTWRRHLDGVYEVYESLLRV